MSQKIKTTLLYTLPSIIIATLIVVGIIFAWTEPTDVPPGGNVPAPINTGSTGQSKQGNLMLNTDGTLAYGLLVPFGNVGIGTTNPQSKLSFGYASPNVTQRIALYERTDLGGGAFRGIGMANPAAGSYGVGIWALSSGSDLPTDNNMAVFVQDGGNVGIGTTEPGAKLDVNDAVTIRSGYDRGYDRTIGAGTGNVLEILGNQGVVSGEPAGGFGIVSGPNIASPIVWLYAFGDRNAFQVIRKSYDGNLGTDPALLHVDVTGNVGIGTTEPKTKLDVDGLIRTGRYSLSGSGGSTPPAASADNKGAIFYNTDNDIMYYSNGSSWQPMGGGGFFGSWTNKDSNNNTLVKDAVYRATSDGFVLGYRYQNDCQITFYTDSSNPPTTMRGETWGDNAQGTYVMFPVKNGDYWKITGSDLNAIHWLPMGSGESQRQ